MKKLPNNYLNVWKHSSQWKQKKAVKIIWFHTDLKINLRLNFLNFLESETKKKMQIDSLIKFDRNKSMWTFIDIIPKVNETDNCVWWLINLV